MVAHKAKVEPRRKKRDRPVEPYEKRHQGRSPGRYLGKDGVSIEVLAGD
jgi:hypothetical protein